MTAATGLSPRTAKRALSWRAAAPSRPRRIALTLTALGVLGQIAYPLAGTGLRDVLTVTTVAALFGAMLIDAVTTTDRWVRAAAAVLLLGLTSYAVELVGVHTGLPFGRYRYTGGLGPAPGGVPVLVALSWATMATIALRAARVLRPRGGTGAVVAIAAATLVTWDVFLDPQMVADGHWQWADTSPGAYGVPLTNVVGWVVVAVVLVAVLQLALPRPGLRLADCPAAQAVPATILLWTLTAEVLGNLVFFGRPMLGVVGGVLMGVTVLPYARALWRRR